MSLYIRRLTYSALFLALALVLPFLTAQIPEIGSMLCPMHIPVLLCGFICGWPWGLAIGFVAPLLRFFIFGMPPLYPVAIAMSFELAAYGAISGILYHVLPKKTAYIYISLITAMIIGRIVWGIAEVILLNFKDNAFTFQMFISGSVTKAIPGIILQIVLIPFIVMLLKKAKITAN